MYLSLGYRYGRDAVPGQMPQMFAMAWLTDVPVRGVINRQSWLVDAAL
jgi:hypothetical protein